MDDRNRTGLSTSAQRRPTTSAEGIKDTLQSILIAFILAFIFRAFVVEAFVIPTGSMAPTLLGAHMRFTCPDCGYGFTVNYSAGEAGDETQIPNRASPGKVFSIRCPNCGLHLPRSLTTSPPVFFGDRILVLKYLYLVQEPQRWDVVVFKSPADPRYETNYIKRLVGKPGESVMVLDGDVYVRRTGQQTYAVQTKPTVVQDALWRIVYDNDYYPQRRDRISEEPWEQPWTPVNDGSGWELGSRPTNGRVFRFDNPDGQATLAFNAGANRGQHAFTDWLAYNITSPRQQGRGSRPDSYNSGDGFAINNVSDVRLSMHYQRISGDGALRLMLTKLDDTFIAEISPEKATLWRQRGNDAPVPIGQPAALRPRSGPMRIDFQNVDYQVTLRIDGRDAIVSTPDEYSPDMDRLLEAYRRHQTLPQPGVKIQASAQRCQLSHLSLWRDVYYTNRSQQDTQLRSGTPETPAVLGSKEYFVVGDNSMLSYDARYWEQPIDLPLESLYADAGKVPDRFMLGKAFFVYWPAGYRPLTEDGPSLVPNFGEMRFIH